MENQELLKALKDVINAYSKLDEVLSSQGETVYVYGGDATDVTDELINLHYIERFGGKKEDFKDNNRLSYLFEND